MDYGTEKFFGFERHGVPKYVCGKVMWEVGLLPIYWDAKNYVDILSFMSLFYNFA